jgi:hypothetical protein
VPRGEPLTLGSLVKWAREGGWEFEGVGVENYDDFYAVGPANKYLYVPTGAMWPSESVNAILPPRMVARDDWGEPIFQKASEWLMKNRVVHSLVFDPALAPLSEDLVAKSQGVEYHKGATLYNRYQPPTITLGDSSKGSRWEAHVRLLFPNKAEADHIIAWCAHRVQKPGEKIRHALVIGGPPGVGKDTIFEAILPALGAWNAYSISPDAIFSGFNEYAAAVFLRINEVVDLHEISR